MVQIGREVVDGGTESRGGREMGRWIQRNGGGEKDGN